MGKVFSPYIRLEALDYLVLAYNIIQPLRPVLLNPDLLFDGDPS
jgi:hypothetical protein